MVFLPFIAAIIVAFWPKTRQDGIKYFTLFTSLAQVVLGVCLIIWYQHGEPTGYNITGFQFVEQARWIQLDLGSIGTLSATYLIGVDGLNVALVLLTIGIMFIAVIASWHIRDKVKGYFSLLLILNGAIIGCFVSLDLLLFYLFFEFMLLPMYFLIGLWGGPRRAYASIKFFLYTLLGSIFILIVMVALYMSVIDPAATAVEAGLAANESAVTSAKINEVHQSLKAGTLKNHQLVHTFNMLHMADWQNYIPGAILDADTIQWVAGYPARLVAFMLIFIGFAIKLPVVPLHTWLPDAHVEAPSPISVVLAALLLKVGGYGLIRAGYLIFPDGAVHYAWFIGLVGVISIVYAAMNALASKDLKRLIAYSSVSHMGFVLLGLASLTAEGIGGAIYQLISHGIISAGLFLIAGVIYDRAHDRLIHNYSGLASKMPRYTVIVVMFFFASLGLPGFSGFIAEIFVLLGAFYASVVSELIPQWMPVLALIGIVITAAYYLWTIQRMFFGPYHVKIKDAKLPDVTGREMLMFIPLAIAALLLGIFPDLLLSMINTTVNTIVDFVGSNNITYK